MVNGWVENYGQVQGPLIEKCLGYWNKRHDHPMLIISFEDMKTDLEAVVRKVYAFLDKSVPEDKLPILLEHLSYSSMKKNDMVNKSDLIDVSINFIFYTFFC